MNLTEHEKYIIQTALNHYFHHLSGLDQSKMGNIEQRVIKTEIKDTKELLLAKFNQ